MTPEQARAFLAQIQQRADGELAALLAPFIRALTSSVESAGEGREGQIPPLNAGALHAIVEAGVRAIFGGAPGDVFQGNGTPRVPFARMLANQIEAAIAAPVDAMIDQMIEILGERRPDLLDALIGEDAPLPELPFSKAPVFDQARIWVDPNGYRLSDRIWQNGQNVRAAIDQAIDQGIQAGTSATQLAKGLEEYLTVDGATVPRRVRQPDGTYARERMPRATKTPYGTSGLYALRRLARTEITRAHGAATVEAAKRSPFTDGVKWDLSGNHPEPDICDQYARSNEYDLGSDVYPPKQLPTYPAHPHERCNLTPHARRSIEQVIDDLGRWANGEPVPGFEKLGTVPLESQMMIKWLSGFGPPPDDDMARRGLFGGMPIPARGTTSLAPDRRHGDRGGGGGGSSLPPGAGDPTGPGSQISTHFALEPATEANFRRLQRKVQATLEGIDTLHSIPAGTRIPLYYTSSIIDRGALRYSTQDGRVLEVLISERGAHPRLTTAHETGHYIDRYALQVAGGHPPRAFATHPPALPALQDWALVTFQSSAVTHMRELSNPLSPLYVHNNALQVDIDYNLRVEELWARSYAQWVATRVNSQPLMQDLQFARSQVTRFKPYWDNDDFIPIGVAIDRLFRALGWIPPAGRRR